MTEFRKQGLYKAVGYNTNKIFQAKYEIYFIHFHFKLTYLFKHVQYFGVNVYVRVYVRMYVRVYVRVYPKIVLYSQIQFAEEYKYCCEKIKFIRNV